MLKPILKDILYLTDYVSIRGYERGVEENLHPGGWTGVYSGKKKGMHNFLFMQTEHKYKMYDGAFYPILGALRFLVEKKKEGTAYSWRLDSFSEVKKMFRRNSSKVVNHYA